MPRTISLSLVLVLAIASTAAAAKPRAKTPHRFTSVTQLTMKSSALGYPSAKGTAVLSGTLKLDPFGDGTIVDNLTITGHPTATVWTFAGREVAVLAGGTVKSKFTGWSLLHPDGTTALAVDGAFTGGTGAYRGARGTYRYTGSTPAGSTITSGRSAGTIIY
jgi:hypothetical protein